MCFFNCTSRVPPWGKALIYRILLPVTLIFAAIIRPCFLSIGYVFLAMMSAQLPGIRKDSPIPRSIAVYVIFTLVYTILVTLSTSSYQIFEKILRKKEADYVALCESEEMNLYRGIGFIRFHGGDGFESLRAILPEIVVLPIAILTFVTVYCLSHREQELDVVGGVVAVREPPTRAEGGVNKKAVGQALAYVMRRLTNFTIILYASFVGCTQASLLNFIYFFAFLCTLTWWATYKKIRHANYNILKKIVMWYCVLHVCVLYAYQIPIVHTKWIPIKSLAARLLGLNVIMDAKCPQWWRFPFVSVDLDPTQSDVWPRFVNPFSVFVFYYVLVWQYKFTRNGSHGESDDYDGESSVHEELLGSRDTPEEGLAPDDGIPMKKVSTQAVDRNKLSHIFTAPGEEETVTSKSLVAVISFLIYHSYAFALASMMMWALLYHSVFGLILLVLTCLIWIFRETRSVALSLAPLILFYVELLLIFQYILSMDISPEIGTPLWMQWLGISWADSPVHAMIMLNVKTLLSIPVFLLLRLSRRERFYESLSDHERARRLNSYGTFSQIPTTQPNARARALSQRRQKANTFAQLVQYLSSRLAVYFIFFLSFVLLIVSTHFKPNFYTIGFFVIWALSILYLKISFRLFRGVAYVFWLSLTFYTSLVIIALYVYQFPGFSDWLQRTTGISKEWLDAIGLVNYASTGQATYLFVRLFAPVSLFVVTMLQLKFFHDPWCAAVSPRPRIAAETPTIEAPPGPSRTPKKHETLIKRIRKMAADTRELAWRFFEVHISSIVFVIIAIFVANNIYAMYIPLVLLLSLAICMPSAADGIFSLLMCSYLFLCAIAKMVYQLDVVPHFGQLDRGVGADNCTYNTTLSEWFGLDKELNKSPFNILSGILVSVIALAFQSIVTYRQRHFRITHGVSEDTRKRIFPDFNPEHFDRSLPNGIRFLLDFGFYKFGFEISLITMGIDAWVRMDGLAAVQCFWIGLFALNKRPFQRNVWPIYCIYMAIIYPLQFIMYVGLPPDSCIVYPWSNLLPSFSTEANKNFAILLGLSTYESPWPPSYLVCDFFVLLVTACQLAVFRKESHDNDSIYSDGDYNLKPNNPKYDFMDIKKSFVDYVKVAIFHYGHWLTLVATLSAGIAGTSFFSLGYIILTLWLLWQGNNLYVMNSRSHAFRTTLGRWNLLIGYTLFTIFAKVVLQIFGCVFISLLFVENPSSAVSFSRVLCVVRQLFSIACVNKLAMTNVIPGEADYDRRCPVDANEAEIGFDIIALAFLVFQSRIFHSWYFQHCMVEYRSEVILANRGAVLKNQLIEKEMKEQNEQQKAKFNEVVRRTALIRERYKKQLEKGGDEVMDPKTYAQAKRAGDYYMFNYDPEKDELVEPVASFIPEPNPQATQYDRLDPGQLVYAATTHDMDLKKTMEAVREAEKIKDPDEKMVAALGDDPNKKRKSGGSDEEEYDDEEDDEDREDAGVDAPPRKKESKIELLIRFMSRIFISTADFVSVQMNKLCREHRYVGYVLNKEKTKLKEEYAESLSNTSRKLTELRTDVNLTQLQMVSTTNDVDKMESAAIHDWQAKSTIARFFNALGACVAAHTDMICYILTIIVQMLTAGLLTMPLPLMALFWGSLSNPRPSKFFWVTMITYTEFVIVIKFVSQFQFFPFNQTEYISTNNVNPLSWDKIIGVSNEKEARTFFGDIALLFALFFHRYMLRKFGLWKDANLTDTFTGDLEEQPNHRQIAAGESDSAKMDQSATDNEVVDVARAAESVLNVAVDPDSPFSRFIKQLFHPKFRYIRDLYPLMFGLDVICFLIMTIGYSGFGEGGSGDVLGDIQSSRIPVTLVAMLIIMTIAIILDRALYLRKWVLGKLIYQLIIITAIHVWIFFILPQITRRSAVTNKVAQALYFFKSLYLLVSAWQIRNGYPELCTGNLLQNSYGMTNFVVFKVFMLLPFLFELRTAIDWTWTDTSMPLFDYFSMENFYAMLFNIKCLRVFEQKYPAARGVKKGLIVKYFMGFPLILGIVIFVWSPLLAYSLLNQIGSIQMPEKVTLSVSIEGYPALFQVEAQGNNNEELHTIESAKLATLTEQFAVRYNSKDIESIKRSRSAISLLKEYTLNDILVVRFRPESQIYWPISNDAVEAVVERLNTTDAELFFSVDIAFTRPYDKGKKTAMEHKQSWRRKITNDPTERKKIADAIKLASLDSVIIPNSIPAYVIVPNEGAVIVPQALSDSILLDDGGVPLIPNATNDEQEVRWFDTISLNLTTGVVRNQLMWRANAEHPNVTKEVFLPTTKTTYSGLPYVQVIAFVDRAFPSIFTSFLSKGVIAMYLTVVFAVGRGVVRGIFAKSPRDVMYEEIPNPDHLVKICLDIYLVREAKDFVLEQDLYAKLIFLFRSPATLIEWTRYPKKKLE